MGAKEDKTHAYNEKLAFVGSESGIVILSITADSGGD